MKSKTKPKAGSSLLAIFAIMASIPLGYKTLALLQGGNKKAGTVANLVVAARPLGSVLYAYSGARNVVVLGSEPHCNEHAHNWNMDQIGKETTVVDVSNRKNNRIERYTKKVGGKYINLISLITAERKKHKFSHKKGQMEQHIWLSPRLMAIALRGIIEENKGTKHGYNKQVGVQGAELLNQLHNRIGRKMYNCKGTVFDMDGSFKNFATEYKLNYKGAIIENGKLANKQNIKKMEEEIRKEGKVCLIADESHYSKIGPRIVRSIRKIGRKQIELIMVDIDGKNVTIENGLNAYQLYIEAVVGKIQNCVCN